MFLPFLLAVLTPELTNFTHAMGRKLPSGYGGACVRCSKGFLLNLKSMTSHNSLSNPEGRRIIMQCG